MTRLGKIARLPRQIREELNRRLADGEIGIRLVDWLNGLPQVQSVLAGEFGGRLINEQNLSDWKQAGFEDWLRHQEACAWTRRLVEEEDDLKAESGAIPLAERLTVPVLVRLGGLLGDLSATSGGPEERKLVLGLAQQLAQLNRAKVAADRLSLERQYWETKQAEAREKKRRILESAERRRRIRERYFPDWDDLGPPSANSWPEELEVCLAANHRLLLAQGEAGDQGRSR